VVELELVRELRDRDDEHEVEEELEVARTPTVALFERSEPRREEQRLDAGVGRGRHAGE
jgi:hypothetical protein